MLYLTDELAAFIVAAAQLAKDKRQYPKLTPFFKKKLPEAWRTVLDEVFHAAVYDGFFVTPPKEEDLYGSWRGLMKMVKLCAQIGINVDILRQAQDDITQDDNDNHNT